MKKLNFYMLVGLFLSFPCVLFAQQSHLEGRVTDAQKEVLEGATVILYLNDSISNATIVNKKGNFKLENIVQGNYLLQISMLGYKPYEKQLVLSKNLSIGEIRLEEDAKMMNEVLVSADKRDLIFTKGGGTTFQLSDRVRNVSRNAFEALREIPLLMIDETNRKIQLNDGSIPLILVNGVSRPGIINSLDPKDIESVEVIENASARYRSSGGETTTILNLKIKRETTLAASASVYTKQNPEFIFGVSGGSFDLGNSKTSLYLNVQHFYFDKEKREQESRTQIGTMTRQWNGTSTYDANSLSLSLGGDWIASPRDYLAFGIEYVTNPAEFGNQSTGLVSNGTSSYSGRMENFVKNKYFTNVYSLFYKRTFSNNRHLEATAKFGWFGSGNTGWRMESSDLYAYHTQIDMDNDKKSLTFDLNYDFMIPNKLAFNIGSNTYWQRNNLEDEVDAFPPFIFKGLNEYVYADMRSLSNSKFSYMLSVGVDMVFNNADGVKHDYINLVPSLTLSYNFNKGNTLQLIASRDRTSPLISRLNPRNVSTDSLQINVGNPYLEPSISNKFRLSYKWSPKGVYLEPFVEYTIHEDLIQAVSTIEGPLRKTTYENLGDISIFRTGLTARLNLGKWGNISNTIYYNKRLDDKQYFSGNHWGGNVNLNLFYKNFSLNALVNYNMMTYSRVSKTSMTPISETTFSWHLPKGWSLTASIRDIGKSLSKSWGKDVDYEYYNRTYNKERGNMILVGFNYYINNKVNNPYRNKKRLRNSDSGIGVKIE